MKIKTGRRKAIEVIDDYIEGVGIKHQPSANLGPYEYEVMDIRGTDDLYIRLTKEEVRAVRNDLKDVVELLVRKAYAEGRKDGKEDGGKLALLPLKSAMKILKDSLG